jgi:hypothetical protein
MWGAAGQVEALQLSAAAQIPSQPFDRLPGRVWQVC